MRTPRRRIQRAVERIGSSGTANMRLGPASKSCGCALCQPGPLDKGRGTDTRMFGPRCKCDDIRNLSSGSIPGLTGLAGRSSGTTGSDVGGLDMDRCSFQTVAQKRLVV